MPRPLTGPIHPLRPRVVRWWFLHRGEAVVYALLAVLTTYGTARELAASGVSWLVVAGVAPLAGAVTVGVVWLLLMACYAACAAVGLMTRAIGRRLAPLTAALGTGAVGVLLVALVVFVVGGVVGLLRLGWRSL